MKTWILLVTFFVYPGTNFAPKTESKQDKIYEGA